MAFSFVQRGKYDSHDGRRVVICTPALSFQFISCRPAYCCSLCVSATFATRAMVIVMLPVEQVLVCVLVMVSHTHENEKQCLGVCTMGVNLRMNILLYVCVCVRVV